MLCNRCRLQLQSMAHLHALLSSSNTKNNAHTICQQASSVHRHNQVHGTGPWLFHLAMSAAGYDDLLWYTTYSKRPTLRDQGAAEKGSGLALADPHTRTKQNVWTAPHWLKGGGGETKELLSNATYISMLTAAAADHSPHTHTTMHHRRNTKNNEHAICQQASSVHRHKKYTDFYVSRR